MAVLTDFSPLSRRLVKTSPLPANTSCFLTRKASLQQLLTQLSSCSAKVLPPLLGPLELKPFSFQIQLQTKTLTHWEEPHVYVGGDKSQAEP